MLCRKKAEVVGGGENKNYGVVKSATGTVAGERTKIFADITQKRL